MTSSAGPPQNEVPVERLATPSAGIDKSFIAWAIPVFGLLFLGLAPLYIHWLAAIAVVMATNSRTLIRSEHL